MPVVGIEQGDVAFTDVGCYYNGLLRPGGTRICSRLPRSRASFSPALTRASLFSALLRVGLLQFGHLCDTLVMVARTAPGRRLEIGLISELF